MELQMATASAVVLQYNGSWIELGSESGLCMINILKSPTNEYRYVAQKISNNEVVLNAYIFPEMKYDETTPTFHQWYDKNRCAFGLNFPDPAVAKKYAAAVACVLEQLNTPQEAPKINVPFNDRKAPSSFGGSNKPAVDNSPKGSSKVSPYATSSVGINAPQTNTSSAPVKPSTAPVKSSGGAPPPPGPPPSAPAPPGPPPPGPSVSKPSQKAAGNDFASQLQKAAEQHKHVDIDESLNKSSAVVVESKPNNPPQSGGGGGGGGGMDLFAEMRAKMNKKTSNIQDGGAPATPKVPVKTAPSGVPNTSSAKSMPSRPSLIDQEPSGGTYVTAADLEKFRNDLMKDIVSNMEKMKDEIISSISAKLK